MKFLSFLIFFFLYIGNSHNFNENEDDSPQNQINFKISSLFNFHCIYDNEQFCHPYYIISFPSDQIKNFSPSIQCTRNPEFKEILLFTPKYCENRIKIEFYQFISFPIMENLIKANFSQMNSFENLKNIDLRELLSFELENVPNGQSSHFLMMKTMNYEQEKNEKYILPSCLKIEMSWKNANCQTNQNIDTLNKIKGLKYCKEEFSEFFSVDDKILLFSDRKYELECEKKDKVFDMNKFLEMKIYAMILRKYCQITPKDMRNLYFFLHYQQFLKNHLLQFQEDLEAFTKDLQNYKEIFEYLNDENYEISIKENSRYLNEIVNDYMEEKETSTKINNDKFDKNSNYTINFKEMMLKELVKNEKINITFVNISHRPKHRILNQNSSNMTNSSTILDINKTLPNVKGTNKTVIYVNNTNNSTASNNSSNNNSNISKELLGNSINNINSLLLSKKNSTNKTNDTNVITNNSSAFIDQIIVANFSKNICPDGKICLLNESTIDYLSEEILEEYLSEESSIF